MLTGGQGAGAIAQTDRNRCRGRINLCLELQLAKGVDNQSGLLPVLWQIIPTYRGTRETSQYPGEAVDDKLQAFLL